MRQSVPFERIPWPLATAYEKASRMAIESYYCPVAEEIVSSIKTGLILDLGTGPGFLPVEIVKRAPHIQMVGVDLSRKLIGMARVNAKSVGLSGQLRFEVANSAKLRFDDASFDMVISTGMLHSLKEPVRIFAEIYRVLKKGSQAWIYDAANVSKFVDRIKWRSSLNFRERFYLWSFMLTGLHKPAEAYSRSQVISIIEASYFKDYTVDEKEGEVRIKLRK